MDDNYILILSENPQWYALLVLFDINQQWLINKSFMSCRRLDIILSNADSE